MHVFLVYGQEELCFIVQRTLSFLKHNGLRILIYDEE